MVMRLSLFAVLCLMLASCGGSGVTAAPPTISYRITGGDLGFAYASAQQWCQSYGTTPVLQALGPFDPEIPAGGTAERTVVYSCSGPPGVATAGLHGNATSGVGSSMPPAAPKP